MSTVNLSFVYALELTPKEYRLVGLALSGRLNSGEDVRAALELNAKLQDQRRRFVASLAESVTDAAEMAAKDLVAPEATLARFGRQDMRFKTTEQTLGDDTGATV